MSASVDTPSWISKKAKTERNWLKFGWIGMSYQNGGAIACKMMKWNSSHYKPFPWDEWTWNEIVNNSE